LGIKDNISEAKTKTKFEKIMQELVSEQNPSAFNQGLMEIGALVCTPRSPSCLHCPIRLQCTAFDQGLVEQLPVKGKQAKQKELDYYVLLIRDKDGRAAIEQRPAKGLLANMWQFPMVATDTIQMNEWIDNPYHVAIRLTEERGRIRHVF